MNSKYKPTTTEDKALFEVKQTYMFAVFEKTLLTDQGKAYVESTRKSLMLSLFIGALANMLSSRQKHHSKPPRSYRISRLANSGGEGSAWRGPTSSFVLHWQNQVRLYETQVESEEYFSNGQKRHML
jgi:hypothetical protein